MGSWCEDAVSSVWKEWLEWSQPAPWPRLVLSICGKYTNLYLAQTHVFLTFQLPPWPFTLDNSNLFCPNRIPAFPFSPNLSLPQLSIVRSMPIAQWASLLLIQLWPKNNGIILHSFLTLVLHIRGACLLSKCYWELVSSPGILPPKDSDAHTPPPSPCHLLSPTTTISHSRLLTGLPASTLASRQFVCHTAATVIFSKSPYDHITH